MNKDYSAVSFKTLDIDSSRDNVLEVTSFVDANLELNGCSPKAMIQIDVALDEVFGNISAYAYGDKKGPVSVQVGFSDGKAIIRFFDSGMPYNPLEAADPDVTLSIEERKVGGLGVFIVKKTMDEVFYEFVDGQNVLTLVKSI